MITLKEGKLGEGMSFSAIFQALTGISLRSYPCRLTPAQAQTVLNAVLAVETSSSAMRGRSIESVLRCGFRFGY